MTTEKVWENIDEVVESFNEYGFENASLSRCGDGFLLTMRYTFAHGMGCITVPIEFDGTEHDLCRAAMNFISVVEQQMFCVRDDLNKATCAAFNIILNEQEEA